MQPTQVAQPFHVEGFAYEEKVDGWPMVAYKGGGTVRRTRPGPQEQIVGHTLAPLV
jgi:hypothetical protein